MAFATVLVLALLTSAIVSLGLFSSVSANQQGNLPQLSMPIEHVDYTITEINRTLWAKIGGNYPIYLNNQTGYVFGVDLPIVYPMPPNSTNIHVFLGKRVELV